jgi:DNA-binding NarL/FixJ family response regulator
MIIDGVMPKKNGKEVYDEMIKIKPDIKVLFTSGCARDIVQSYFKTAFTKETIAQSKGNTG